MSDQPQDNKPQRPTPPPTPKFSRSLLMWVIIIGLGLMLITLWQRGFGNRRELTATEFWKHARNGQVVGVVQVGDSQIEGTLAENTPGLAADDPRKFYVTYDYRANEGFEEELRQALKGRAEIKYIRTSWLEGVLPHIVLMGVVFLMIWFFLFRRIGAATGGGGFLGNFGRSKHRVLTKEHTQVTFEDVAGIEEAKDEVSEIVEFLKSPRKFQRLGGRVPRGVLLVGEPGCGKTLLAKAIAGEAEVPFFSISGSDFVEMFVGVGASRVRDLFKQAKDSSPCIIFLDEIDAVGRRRGMGFNGGGHDEREQTLNAILVEMDGFDSSDQIIVIAATNRADVLDPALTRPGRFDRQIMVPLPDLKGRTQILRIYLEKIKASTQIDVERLARGTPMFSGADLEALVNEAAISATLAGKDFVEMADLEEARDKVRWGRQRKSRVIDEEERDITAYHEAGHAVVQALLPHADPLHKVSIIPRGKMGGATFSLPEKDRYLYSRKYLQALLRVALAGRVAEEVFCDDVTSGAQNDIAQVTEIAKKMVLDWGMSDQVGMINYTNDDKRIMPMDASGREYSEVTAELIDKEVRGLIDTAYRDTREMIERNRDKLERVTQALLKYETLSADEVQALIDGQSLDKPTVGELLDREQQKDQAAGSTGKLTGEADTNTPPPDLGTLPEPG